MVAHGTKPGSVIRPTAMRLAFIEAGVVPPKGSEVGLVRESAWTLNGRKLRKVMRRRKGKKGKRK